jgi:hypothetical protein
MNDFGSKRYAILVFACLLRNREPTILYDDTIPTFAVSSVAHTWLEPNPCANDRRETFLGSLILIFQCLFLSSIGCGRCC